MPRSSRTGSDAPEGPSRARAPRRRELERLNRQLRELVSELSAPGRLIGESAPMRRVHAMISAVAHTDTTVMIRGEAGTGKTLVARAIHAASARRHHPFVTLSCGPSAADTLEDELCGTRGAGGRGRPGRLE